MREPTLYRIIRPVLTFLFKIGFHPKIIGKENIPIEGKCILAGNHKSNFDCVLVFASTKRTIHYLAKEELSKGILGFIFNGFGIIPVHRKGKDKAALKSAIHYLNKDRLIGIFPEGKRNKKGDNLLPFKIGAVKMAFETNSPIVPFSIIGKYNILGKGVTIVFDKPYKVETDNLEEENLLLMNKINKMILERR